jgi:hypothetical protein
MPLLESRDTPFSEGHEGHKHGRACSYRHTLTNWQLPEARNSRWCRRIPSPFGCSEEPFGLPDTKGVPGKDPVMGHSHVSPPSLWTFAFSEHGTIKVMPFSKHVRTSVHDIVRLCEARLHEGVLTQSSMLQSSACAQHGTLEECLFSVRCHKVTPAQITTPKWGPVLRRRAP